MTEEIESLLEQFDAATDTEGKIHILNTITDTLRTSDAQSALAYAEQALQLAQSYDLQTETPQQCTAMALRNLGRLNYLLSNYNTALSYTFEALTRFEALEAPHEQATALTTIASIYLLLGAYPESLAYFIKVLDIWEQLENQAGQAAALNKVGYLYTNLEEYNRALAYLDRSAKIAQELEDVKLQADVLDNRSKVYTALSDYKSALQCALESVQLYETCDNQQGKAEALVSIGLLYQAQGEYTPALVYFGQALEIFQNIETKYSEASVLAHIAETYFREKDETDAALTHVEQALNIAQEIGARKVGFRCYHTLAKIHERQGNFEQALAHYEHYHAVKHSVFNEEADQRLKNLEIAHEVETARKEAEIARLKNIELEREITERKRAEAALQASAAKTAALYQLVRTLASHDTLPTMLQAVAKTVASKLPASQTILHTFELETQQITHFVEGKSGFEHPFRPPFDTLMESVVGWAVAKEQPVLSPRDRPDPREAKWVQKQRAAQGIGSVIVIPLYYGGNMFGALTAINRTDEPDFDHEDLALLRAMSSQIAIAISNFQRSEEMARLKGFNENIVQGVGEAILIVDDNGFLIFANPAAETLLGYTNKELLGHHWSKFVAEQELEQTYKIIAELAPNRHERYETVLQDKAQQNIPVIVSISPLMEKGLITGALAAFTDITDLKDAEEELRQRSVELEIQNVELDAFAHTVAHDLRSPLTTVIGFSDLLATRYEDLSEDRRAYGLQSISESGHKMSEIVNELLLLAKVREMNGVEKHPLDMNEMIIDVKKRLNYQLEKSEAEIVSPSKWPIAIGYTPWIEEVWANYISNAIKYGGAPPHIELGFDEKIIEKTDAQSDTKTIKVSHIRFWVKDNGKGLTQEEQDQLFIPFERLNQAHAEGHGLGLSIVRRIVERLDGTVGIESEIGEGSTFYFTLPPKL